MTENYNFNPDFWEENWNGFLVFGVWPGYYIWTGLKYDVKSYLKNSADFDNFSRSGAPYNQLGELGTGWWLEVKDPERVCERIQAPLFHPNLTYISFPACSPSYILLAAWPKSTYEAAHRVLFWVWSVNFFWQVESDLRINRLRDRVIGRVHCAASCCGFPRLLPHFVTHFSGSAAASASGNSPVAI